MKTELKFGVIIGLGMFFWVVLEFLFGFHTTNIAMHPIITNFAFLIPVLGFVFAMKEKRDKEFNGGLPYGKGFKAGMTITGIVIIISLAGQIVYHEIINPDFFETMKAYLAKNDPNITVEAMEAYFNMTSYLLQVAGGSFLLGLILSLITPLFFRKGRK